VSVKPDLDGVPETALWTLWFRAAAARGDQRLLDDPMAIDVVDKLDYPFAERFGQLFPAHARVQALRVRTFDREVRDFLREHPDGTVVALGEGLETQFWRVAAGTNMERVRWLTVDLPESVALRGQVLPAHERQRVFAGSALDPAWLDLVDPSRGVLITAQGLLMYLPPDDVRALIARCAERFPGGGMVFDAVPPWMAGEVRRGTPNFQPPPLPWTLRATELEQLKEMSPAIAAVRDVRPPSSPGLLGWLLPRLRYLPVIRRARPMVVALRFNPPAPSHRHRG
jgi:O-methyltransferase involved in polyketide biosynthesis